MESIIVYRNPAEAAMWEALQGPATFPIFAGIAVGIGTLVLLHSLFPVNPFRQFKQPGQIRPVKQRLKAALGTIHGIVAIAAGLGTTYFLWI